MNHPFSYLLPEYIKLLATMKVNSDRVSEVNSWAAKLTGPLYWPRYEQVAMLTGVPAELIAALDYRESSASPRCALGQGDPWSEVSKHYPVGCGPFNSWVDAAVYYMHREHMDDATHEWSWPYICWKAEAWNGFGPRDHGIHTGYLWAGTNHYLRGKYVADGKWDAGFVDGQLGAIPLMLRIAEVRGTLGRYPGMPGKVDAPMGKPQPAPAGLGAQGQHDVVWLQRSLNKITLPPDQLPVDGNYGRHTRAAVFDYQKARGLKADGLFGPATDAALTKDVGE